MLANPKNNTLQGGGHSRLWPAEQGKEDKEIKSGRALQPSPPTLLVRRKQNKGRVQQREQKEQMAGRASCDAST